MNTKKYLSQLKILDTKIRQKQDEAESLKSMIEGRAMQYNSDRVQTSPKNMQEEIICKYMDMQNVISKQIADYIDRKEKIINQIQSLDDDRYIQVLYLHYVPNAEHKTMRLEEIACTMKKPNGDHYNYEYISRLHGLALQNFRKKFANVIEMSS